MTDPNRPPNQPPTPPPPPRPTPAPSPTNADVLRQFDDTLLALAAITHVDPLFRATVPTLAAGDPVTDLRHHLRKALLAARRVAAMHTETPARRDVPQDVAPTGGPVLPPDAPGERLVPGYAAAMDSAAGESGGGLPAPAAGASFRLVSDGEEGPAPGPGAHGGASGRVAGAGFTLPRRKGLPRFDTGEHRLVGQLCAEPDAETLAAVVSVLRQT